jgi:uncharacterized protein YjiS (DUF1127 family)
MFSKLATLFKSLQLAAGANESFRQLNNMNDAQLRDIGLQRGDIRGIVEGTLKHGSLIHKSAH